MTRNQEIASIILQQMGTTPNRLYAMMKGQCLAIENGLQINFKGSRKANKVQIVLNADDTYTMTFFKFNRRTFDCPVVAELEGMYFDMLRSYFEQTTGLYVSL